MPLTPTQEILARNAAQRILLAQNLVELMGEPQSSVVIPYDEAQCLLVACATTLGLDIGALDLGPWHAPAEQSQPYGGPFPR